MGLDIGCIFLIFSIVLRYGTQSIYGRSGLILFISIITCLVCFIGGFRSIRLLNTERQMEAVGAKNEYELALVKRYKTKNVETAKLVKKSGFHTFKMLLEAQKVGAKDDSQLALVRQYKAPDYETAKLLQKTGFQDYKIYKEAQQVGAETREQLSLVKKYKAPDYETAKLIQPTDFPNYEIYAEAQQVGAKTSDELLIVKKYNASDVASAKTQHSVDCTKKIRATLDRDHGIIFKTFLTQENLVGLSESLMGKIIVKEGYQGIHTDNWEIFIKTDFIRDQLRELTRHYADIQFEVIAQRLKIPNERVPEILIKAIDAQIVFGSVDRTNLCFIVRDVPVSLTEQLLTGQVVTLDQVKQTYGYQIEDSLRLLQQELPNKQYVLTRQESLIRINQISIGCQVCGTSTTLEKFLRCTQCGRDLCWDHFEELGEIGRVICPYCDGSLIFLPQYCEKCHLDYIRVTKSEKVCDFCGYPLVVKDHLRPFYTEYLTLQQKPIMQTGEEEDFKKDSKILKKKG